MGATCPWHGHRRSPLFLCPQPLQTLALALYNPQSTPPNPSRLSLSPIERRRRHDQEIEESLDEKEGRRRREGARSQGGGEKEEKGRAAVATPRKGGARGEPATPSRGSATEELHRACAERRHQRCGSPCTATSRRPRLATASCLTSTSPLVRLNVATSVFPPFCHSCHPVAAPVSLPCCPTSPSH